MQDSQPKLFPKQRSDWNKVKADLQRFRDSDTSERGARLNAYCHQGSDELQTIRDEAYKVYAHGNAFLSGYLDGMGRMEEEVVQMGKEILNAPENGTAFLSGGGGTESIFCAVHAMREWSRIERPVAGPPELILPYSGHAAFDKACHYLDMKIVRVPLGEDLRADPELMEAAVTENTIGIVGSAPCWPYGMIDPITEIANVATKHNLWMHTDCCVGGFINPWLEKLGYSIPAFDFRVPGVRSISADLHKHGFASKSCSIVLYHSKDLEVYHYVPVDNWPCGEYKTKGFAGSRPAGPIATAWSVMKVLGEEGYIDTTRRTMEIKDKLVTGIEAIEDFKCLRNDSTMIFFRSETLDMLTLIGGLEERGYFPFGIFNPVMLQLIPEPVPDELVDGYLADLAEVAAGVKDGSISSTAIARYS